MNHYKIFYWSDGDYGTVYADAPDMATAIKEFLEEHKEEVLTSLECVKVRWTA